MPDAKTMRQQAQKARAAADESRKLAQRESDKTAQFAKNNDQNGAQGAQMLVAKYMQTAVMHEKQAVEHEQQAMKSEEMAMALEKERTALISEYDQKLKDLDKRRLDLLGS